MRKEELLMHQIEIVGSKRLFAIKAFFFLSLISFAIVMYLESKVMLDIAYALVVLILFMKFLKVKLYQ